MRLDEGYVDDDDLAFGMDQLSLLDEGSSSTITQLSPDSREELIYRLVASLPREQIARIQKRIAPLVPLVQVDIVGCLPDELALHVLSYLPWPTLLRCALVNRRWRTLANNNTLWKELCAEREWTWYWRPRGDFELLRLLFPDEDGEGSDEGMSEGDDSDVDTLNEHPLGQTVTCSRDHRTYGLPATPRINQSKRVPSPPRRSKSPSPSRTRAEYNDEEMGGYYRIRNSAPSVLRSVKTRKADYKLLYQTHVLMRNRLAHGSYRFYTLQTRDSSNGHSAIIYCIQLFTYEDNGRQVLFSGSRDRTVREWNLSTGNVDRVFQGIHTESILSICAHGNYLASAGRDFCVCVWDLSTGQVVSLFKEHTDSVLCVRFDSKRLVSCSKDRTIRMYRFIEDGNSSENVLGEGIILGMHRGAVNAITLSGDYVISASGDKSLCVWDANTCTLVHKFDHHHGRGISSVAVRGSFIATGSSDTHVRLLNIDTRGGWGTSTEMNVLPVEDNARDSESRDRHCTVCICETCGTVARHADAYRPDADTPRHCDLVRTVGVNSDFVISGSYDRSVKVWDRDRGFLVADLGGRHEGRIFCVDFDSTKIVSCGEDRMICVWDLAYGIETSFIHP